MAYTFEYFVNKANTLHNQRYEYRSESFSGFGNKVTIVCKEHGDFEQIGSIHLTGTGCPRCASNIRAEAFRKSNKSRRNDDFLERATRIHKDKYDYSQTVYNGLRSRVVIICPNHGSFEQMAQAHIINGQGCPLCAKAKRYGPKDFSGDIFDKTAFLSMLSSEQKSYYNYDNVPEKGALKNISILCPEHGLFEQRASSHVTKKIGCKQCGTKKRVDARAKQAWLGIDGFIAKATAIHGVKYSYNDTVYNGVSKMVVICCNKHGPFEQRAGDHLNGNGCQKCGNFATSHMEVAWLNSLGISTRAKKIRIGKRNLIVDGFCKNSNTVYEFFGDYWHGNPKKYSPEKINSRSKFTFGELYDRTMARISLIESAGYNVVTKWEMDWLNEN